MSILQVVGDCILALGVFFALLGSIGLNRLPSFYMRTHAATKPDTLGVALAMIGLALRTPDTITSIKLLLIAAFVILATPAAAHALGRSALRSGERPLRKSDLEGDANPKGGTA